MKWIEANLLQILEDDILIALGIYSVFASASRIGLTYDGLHHHTLLPSRHNGQEFLKITEKGDRRVGERETDEAKQVDVGCKYEDALGVGRAAALGSVGDATRASLSTFFRHVNGGTSLTIANILGAQLARL